MAISGWGVAWILAGCLLAAIKAALHHLDLYRAEVAKREALEVQLKAVREDRNNLLAQMTELQHLGWVATDQNTDPVWADLVRRLEGEDH